MLDRHQRTRAAYATPGLLTALVKCRALLVWCETSEPEREYSFRWIPTGHAIQGARTGGGYVTMCARIVFGFLSQVVDEGEPSRRPSTGAPSAGPSRSERTVPGVGAGREPRSLFFAAIRPRIPPLWPAAAERVSRLSLSQARL